MCQVTTNAGCTELTAVMIGKLTSSDNRSLARNQPTGMEQRPKQNINPYKIMSSSSMEEGIPAIQGVKVPGSVRVKKAAAMQRLKRVEAMLA